VATPPLRFLMNELRNRFIRRQAKLKLEAFRRMLELQSGRPVAPLDLLPIDPFRIARDLLGLSVEEREEIARPDKSAKLWIPLAGLLSRVEKKLIIAAGLKPELRRFTAAHEIGHYILHPDAIVFRDSPLTDSSLRSPDSSSLREREANLFAAEMLMPGKLVCQLFSRLFGGPVDGESMTDDEAYLLTEGTKYARSLSVVAPFDRAKLVAENPSLVTKEYRNLAQVFGVSSTAIAIQLLDLGLVK